MENTTESQVMRLWNRCRRAPCGRWIFSRLIGWAAPFTGKISPRVLEVKPGYAQIAMRERRRVRQHLRSIHDGALFTLAEAASGIAMSAAVPDTARSIVTSMSIEYLKKARGVVTAVGICEIPDWRQKRNYQVTIEVTDAANDCVARATAQWLVGPKQ